MTVLHPEKNCEFIHELADKYDCPPVKLAAWKILKKKIPGVQAFPTDTTLLKKIKDNGKFLKGTGLTGPGDPAFNSLNNSGGKRFDHLQKKLNEDEEDNLEDENQKNDNLLSVFDGYSQESDEDLDHDEEDFEESRTTKERRQKLQELKKFNTRLEDLARDASAAEVIVAWSRHLKGKLGINLFILLIILSCVNFIDVYAQCAPAEDIEYSGDENDLKFTNDSPNVKLMKKNQSKPHKKDRSDLLGQSLSSQQDNKSKYSDDEEEKSESTMPTKGKESPSSSSVQQNFFSRLLSTGKKSTDNKPSNTIDWAEELKRFYIDVNKPSKISGIKTILKTWHGREDLMLESLLEKYDNQMSSDLRDHLHEILLSYDNKTDNTSPTKATSNNQKSISSPNKKKQTRN